MARYRMRCLLFSLILITGCSSDYKVLRAVSADQSCIDKIKPKGVTTSWYDASIDVVGKHISGLLLIKNMDDHSDRVVFTNEAGVKFLDFGFENNGGFKVHYVIPQLNKKPVIRLLKKDFALMLAIPFKDSSPKAWQNRDEIFYGVTQKKETAYFITDQDCASLQRIELGGRRKRVVTMELHGTDKQKPDSIHLQHHTFAMRITLRKLAKE